uniref:RNA-directed DNA polymerase n=1 Tax=Brugia timori TaxID=42155 RepID=A0A0R3QAS3_9BILA
LPQRQAPPSRRANIWIRPLFQFCCKPWVHWLKNVHRIRLNTWRIIYLRRRIVFRHHSISNNSKMNPAIKSKKIFRNFSIKRCFTEKKLLRFPFLSMFYFSQSLF